MENEIHDLILRDEATRLYNYRGFTCWRNMRCGWRNARMFPSPCFHRYGESYRDSSRSWIECGRQHHWRRRERFCEQHFASRTSRAGSARTDFAVAGQFDRPEFQLLRCDWKRRRRHVVRRAAGDFFAIQHGTCDDCWTRSAGESEGDAGAGRPSQKPTESQLKEALVN